jgi:hypothetical protein
MSLKEVRISNMKWAWIKQRFCSWWEDEELGAMVDDVETVVEACWVEDDKIDVVICCVTTGETEDEDCWFKHNLLAASLRVAACSLHKFGLWTHKCYNNPVVMYYQTTFKLQHLKCRQWIHKYNLLSVSLRATKLLEGCTCEFNGHIWDADVCMLFGSI